jgi:hypothetical protein
MNEIISQLNKAIPFFANIAIGIGVLMTVHGNSIDPNSKNASFFPSNFTLLFVFCFNMLITAQSERIKSLETEVKKMKNILIDKLSDESNIET